MEEPAIPRQATGHPNDSSDRPEIVALREELECSHEEILRLRDLLIAKDAELGRALGRVEQLELRMTRLLGAAAWLRRFGPPTARLRARLRRSQG